MSERLTGKAELISSKELHRAVMLVMADRLHYTVVRDTDLMYHTCEDFIADLTTSCSVPWPPAAPSVPPMARCRP